MTVADYRPSAWERVLTPADGQMSVEKARYLLGLDFWPADHDRMDELGQKASADTLTPAEMSEYDEYIHVGHQSARLQAFARMTLRRANAGE